MKTSKNFRFIILVNFCFKIIEFETQIVHGFCSLGILYVEKIVIDFINIFRIIVVFRIIFKHFIPRFAVTHLLLIP